MADQRQHSGYGGAGQAAGLAGIALPLSAAKRRGRASPPRLCTNDVDDRMRECLRAIARNLSPDEEDLQAQIRAADPNFIPIQKRGMTIMASRWDKSVEYALACLAVGENAAEANDCIVRWCRRYPIDKEHPQDAGDTDPLALLRIALLPQTAALLTDEARTAIEEAAYAYVYRRSQVDPVAPDATMPPLWNNASRSVWHLSGSENHDAVQKMANLLSLQLLCARGRRYTSETELADGRTAREHFAAWTAYWKEFVRQRAREGIFAEVAHPSSYGRMTIGCYMCLYDLAEDPVLRRLGGDMLTLHFAQLAGELHPSTGSRGAIAISRANGAEKQQMGIHWTKSLTYAWGWHNAPDGQILEDEAAPLTTRYRPPATVTAIARGPRLSPYFSTARCIGLGGEKKDFVNEVLFEDGEARNSYLCRTTWVTPEYMLSGLTCDPNRSYLAISTQGRIAGITFASGINDRITVIGYDEPDPASFSFSAINTLPARDCLIVGRDPSGQTVATRVYVANALWSARVEDPSGWVFVRGGDGFCAVRIASGGCQVGPAPYDTGVLLTLNDKDSPVVFQMGRAVDYPGGFDEFRQAVAERARVEFSGTCLRYRSLAGEEMRFWVREKRVPELGSKPLDLNPPETYSSPYLAMKHGTDLARIHYPGFEDVTLDFRYQPG